VSVVLTDVVLPLAHFTLEVSLEARSKATALVGPSGAGKTSLLECIAGLRTPTRGTITLHDRVVFDATTNVPPRSRRVGYVPQDDALFPHMSVRKNVLYGWSVGRSAGWPVEGEATDQPHTFDHVIEVLDLGHVLDRGVGRLSGGERKRVALARALLSGPEVLLLDEPLSGVDAELRTRVLEYLVRVRDTFPIPMLYVTHQREEATAIGEEIAVLDRGRIVRLDRV
jgi:molybdate transport system ATP-binding protein